MAKEQGKALVTVEGAECGLKDGASPESIVQRYSTLSLSDVYSAIGYYLRH